MGNRTQIALSLACLLAFAPALAAGPTHDLQVTIDASRRSKPVSRYAYGMFIEPIGGLVARTLWAEMLDDRKFYYPVLPESKDAPPPPNAEGRPGISYRKWRSFGGVAVVSLVEKDPLAGAFCLCVVVVV